MCRPFAVMLKPVGSSCNMACSYCYYLNNEVSDRKKMTADRLEKIIASYFASNPFEVNSFVWHGGEPTLAGLDFYKEAVRIQKKYLPKGKTYWNNLQTNGLLLNEEWCDFLKKENFDVGISIDGIRLVHDKYRLDAKKEKTYDRVAEKINLLKRYGIKPDLLCTVSADTGENAYEVYQALKNFKTGWIQFIPIVNKNEDGSLREESITPKAYGDFLVTCFHQWLYNDLGTCDVQLFMEVLNYYAGGKQSLCWLKEECGDVLAIESDGHIYSCDHFVNKENLLGSIDSCDLSSCINSNQQSAFGKAKSDLSKKCLQCKYLHLCNGGCPKDRDQDKNNLLCEGLYHFFEESEEPCKKAVSLLRAGNSRDQVMAILRKERKQKWAAVSANSPCPCGSGRKYKHCCGS